MPEMWQRFTPGGGDCDRFWLAFFLGGAALSLILAVLL